MLIGLKDVRVFRYWTAVFAGIEWIRLTFGCRRYFRLVVIPVAVAPAVGFSRCLPLPSGADSSPLLLGPSLITVLCSAVDNGISKDFPRDSAIALWSFCIHISLRSEPVQCNE
jgi:hypothetical protein